MDIQPPEPTRAKEAPQTQHYLIDGVAHELTLPEASAYVEVGKSHIDGVHGDDRRFFAAPGTPGVECNVFLNSGNHAAAGVVVNPDTQGYDKAVQVEMLAPQRDANGNIGSYRWEQAVQSPLSQGDKRSTADVLPAKPITPYSMDRVAQVVYRVTKPGAEPNYFHIKAQFPAPRFTGERFHGDTRGEGDVIVNVAPVRPLVPSVK